MRHLFFFVLALFVATAATAQEGYSVRTGDTLAVEVIQDPSLNRSVLVLPNGTIDFPFAGSVRASGRTPPQIGAAISAAIASNFNAPPTVFVSVQQLRPRVASTGSRTPAPDPTIDIFFLGEWNTPGAREVDPGITMLQALAQGGGFTNFAAQKRIQLRRTNTQTGAVQTVIINYAAIADGSEIIRDFTLQDGDVLVAPERRLFE